MSRVTGIGGAKPTGPGLSHLSYADPKRWRCVYPIYLNNKKKISEGRKVPLKVAVDKPSVQDLIEVCQQLKLPFQAEHDKSYSRDFTSRGRVRVLLRRDDGSFLNPNVRNRQHLLLLLAAQIPLLKTRGQRLEAERKLEEREKKEILHMTAAGENITTSATTTSTPTTPATGGGGGGNNKKKHKKKK